jgi:preprotein translocase subunit Sss1
MRKKEIAALALALWLTIIVLCMLFIERIDLALFFILGFVGFLLIVELMEPRHIKPGYDWYLKVLMGVGIVIFIAFVALKVLDILGLELVIG